MATKDTTATSGDSNSVIEQSAQNVGEIIESGATVVGRGLAAGVEGMGQLAERAGANDWLDLAARHRKSCGERHPIDDDGRTVGRTHHQARRKQHRDGGKPHGGTCDARGEATSGQIDAHRNANRENKTRPSDRAESVGAEGAAEDIPIEIDAVQEKRGEERSKPETLLTI